MQKSKLLYISRLNLENDKHLGTLKKVRGMCKGFLREFDVFMEYEEGSKYVVESSQSNDRVFENDYKGYVGRILFYKNIENWIERNQIEVLYIRFDHLDNVMLSIFKRLKKEGVRVILELPTYPYAGERDERHRQLLVKKKYIEYFVKRLLVKNEEKNIASANKFIERIVTYTYDGTIWGVPTICIENGVDYSEIKVREHFNQSNKIIIGCVANLAVWHAVDRVIEGLKDYYNKASLKYIVEFWIIGNGVEIDHIKELVHLYNLNDRVIFNGSKRGAELVAIMDEFDIGVGTLGLHRIGLEWGSTLKSKEYCASGLPFIYASKEKGLNGNEPFALKFPDDESSIDIDEVVGFALRVRNDRKLRDLMRLKAVEEYSWDFLTKKILSDEAYE